MKAFFSVGRAAVKAFNRNNCFTRAAAISFYAFFSLIPLMFVITAAAGFVLGAKPGLQMRIIGIVKQTIPYLTDKIIVELRYLTASWKTFGWLGLFSLVYSAELVMSEAASALTAIFETGNRSGFLKRKIINLLGVLLAILAALISVMITALSYYLERYEINIIGLGFVYSLLLIVVFRFLAPFLLVAAVVAAVYKLLSGPNLNARYAFFGSVLFTLLWEAAKQLFALYVANFQSYNKLYGSIGALMILLLWIFYSSTIFLFSAAAARSAYLEKQGRKENRVRSWRRG